MSSPVCVIIPAFNAQASIARAVSSALAELEVAEVIVVDDHSSDDTAAAARRADDGSSRLQVFRLEANRGPSAARNLAIRSSRSPLVAILDSDDYFLPGRFARLLSHDGWDLAADNILFVPEGLEGAPPVSVPPRPRWRNLAFAEFVTGNIPVAGRPRAELGFLKPVMKRSMLDSLQLRYDEDVRLGEDYLLYATALAKNARYLISEACGYVAVERAGSLSGNHVTEDLARLIAGDAKLLGMLPGGSVEARLVARHLASVQVRYDHRRFLDDKRDTGLAAAITPFLTRPLALARIARAVLRDKSSKQHAGNTRGPRTLLSEQEFLLLPTLEVDATHVR
ncbi:glycosyltransferase family 2 protein [Sphingomonas sp. S2-65]|uniref:glycosyltransferase family 2 protein n=1 Tax=Sphingomonas sp. S2-65 TaxID=2903960 RepID=UPI001F3C6A7E|nr:glycosyltransferase family 2 protein [Sphingomonas sp. S2-65]UYY57061.1 glycosyltransferase [Sphingomonas sp. S2-65]